MEQNLVGIPLLRFPGIRNSWVGRILQVGLELFVEKIAANLNISAAELLALGIDGLFQRIAEVATLEQFIQTLNELEQYSLANDIKNDVMAYSVVLPRADKQADACFFFLFTSSVEATSLINQLKTYGRLEQKTIQLAGLVVTHLVSINPLCNLSIVIAQLSDGESIQHFINFIGSVPNLVIVHKEMTQIGYTQYCTIDNEATPGNIDAFVNGHAECESKVQRIPATSLAIAARMICNNLANVSLNKSVIMLNDQACENHLFCLVTSMIWNSAPLFPVTSTSLLHFSFASEKERLEQHFAYHQLANHKLLIPVTDRCEVLASVSTFLGCRYLFNKDVLKTNLEMHHLTLNDVKPLTAANLELIIPDVLPRDQERLRIISGMISVTINEPDLPVVGQVHYYTADDRLVEFLYEPQLQLNLPEETPPMPGTPIWLAKGSEVYARDLQIQPARFLTRIKSKQTLLQNGQNLSSRTRYWIATQTVLPLRLYKASGQLKLWMHQTNIDDHEVLEMNFLSIGHYYITIGDGADAERYDLSVVQQSNNNNNNPPNQQTAVGGVAPVVHNNIVVLVPDQNVMQLADASLAAAGFIYALPINESCRGYIRLNQRVILLAYRPNQLILLLDLLQNWASRVTLFAYDAVALTAHTDEAFNLRVVQMQIPLVLNFRPVLFCETYELPINMNAIFSAY